jgi:hypothetical protein
LGSFVCKKAIISGLIFAFSDAPPKRIIFLEAHDPWRHPVKKNTTIPQIIKTKHT